jgi:hypothetical protein
MKISEGHAVHEVQDPPEPPEWRFMALMCFIRLHVGLFFMPFIPFTP